VSRRHPLRTVVSVGALVGLVAIPALTSLASSPHAGAEASAGALGILPNGRLVRPAGDRVTLGDFPLGLAVSPDGRLAIAANAGQGFGVNAGFGTYCDSVGQPGQCPYPLKPSQVGNPATPTPDESLSVVDLVHQRTSTVTVTPTSHDPAHVAFNMFSGRVAFNPAGTHLYATGGGNSAIYDWPVTADQLGPPRTAFPSGRPDGLGGRPIPIFGPTAGYTRGLAVAPDGKSLLVLKEFDDELDVVDATTLQTSHFLIFGPATPASGPDPYDVVVSPDGARAWVSLQGSNQVAMIRLAATGPVLVGTIPVGAHPTAMALTPAGDLLVANADDDTISVINTSTGSVRQTLTVHATVGEQTGSVPNAIAVAKTGRTAYVALAGDDAVAVLQRSLTGTWSSTGLVPTGWYPAAVAIEPKHGSLLTVAAKGLGSQYPAGGAYPPPGNGVGPSGIPTSYYYDGSNMPGLLTRLAVPTGPNLDALTRLVVNNLRFASGSDPFPGTGPIPGPAGGKSPIKHVVYIVRENRTFDQVFGDLGRSRSDVDGDPQLNLLAKATPNAHALAGRYAFADRFFSDGEASIQGHWWTTSANVNDYTEKAWRQYYSLRNRPNDPITPITTPNGCTLFQAAQRKRTASGGTFSFRDYGELVGTLALTYANGGPGLIPVPGCTPLGPAAVDPLYPTQITPLSYDDRLRAGEFLNDVGIDSNGQPLPGANPDTQFLRNFSYLILPEDHTTGLSGPDTPRAEVAQNDAALGTIVSALSKSSYWSSTAVFVVEDDSQDGLDHIDGHRNILMVASPYAKQVAADGTTPGYVGHRHYDQAGVVRTMELILGLDPLSSYDQLAAPLYDMFQPISSASQLTPADLSPYDLAPPPPFINEPVPHQGASPYTDRLLAESRSLDFSQIDRAGAKLEEVLWRSMSQAALPPQLQAELRQSQAASTGSDG
jgi:DNA-binding beta-propeller fold protein YncE